MRSEIKAFGFALIVGLVLFTFLAAFVEFSGEKHTSQQSQARNCMRQVQTCIESYALRHSGHFPLSAEVVKESLCSRNGHFPENPLSKNTNYLFTIDAPKVDQILKGDLQQILELSTPGRIAYGVSSDSQAYVVIGYDDEKHYSKPLRGIGQRVLALTDKNHNLQLQLR